MLLAFMMGEHSLSVTVFSVQPCHQASSDQHSWSTKAHYVMLSFQVLDSKKHCLVYINFSTHVCYYVIIYTREGLFHLGKIIMKVN